MASDNEQMAMHNPSSTPLPSVGPINVPEETSAPHVDASMHPTDHSSSPIITAVVDRQRPSVATTAANFILSQQVSEALAALNRHETLLQINIENAREHLVEAEASLSIARRDLQAAQQMQMVNIAAMQDKRLVRHEGFTLVYDC